MKHLVNIAKQYNIKEVWFEQNFGNGAFKSMIAPYFQKKHKCKLEEHWATGQKELRIIDTIEPFLSSHRLVIHPDAIDSDLKTVEQYATNAQKTYSFLFQTSMITRDKDCLVHDDRLDALQGAIFQISQQLDFDNETEMQRRRAQEQKDWLEKLRNPHNHREDVAIAPQGKTLGSQFSSRNW